MNKLIIAALCALSMNAQAEVFKCQVNGKTVYQQSPCAGQDTAQPMKIDTRDTGNGGVRLGEWKNAALIFAKEGKNEHFQKSLDPFIKANKLDEEMKKLIEERRHQEMIEATTKSGNLKRE